MTNLLSRNRVRRPTTLRKLGRVAQMSAPLSVRELTSLLGPAAFRPRLFYVIGHNRNAITDVNVALDAGANEVEPDINTYAGSPDVLCIANGPPDDVRGA